VELSNPELAQATLEAQYELKVAEAGLVDLRVTLQSDGFDKESAAARVRAVKGGGKIYQWGGVKGSQFWRWRFLPVIAFPHLPVDDVPVIHPVFATGRAAAEAHLLSGWHTRPPRFLR